MPAEAFTPTEAAAFLDLPERQVRKEVEHGLFSTKLGFQALVYLGALRGLGFDLGVEDRRKLFEIVAREVGPKKTTPDMIPFSPVVMLRLGPLVREIRQRVQRFAVWKRKIVTDSKILGGEPVFPKSRLSVRNVGRLLERGASPESIRDDYPYLSDEDLELARLFVKAYPRVGRPCETGQAPAR
jgi:uncharacterized protein (DUF433 family)